MRFKTILNEVLTSQLNSRMKDIENLLTNSKVLYPFLVKAMPFVYKSGYAVNVMLNSKYRALKDEDKDEIKSEIKNIALRQKGIVKSVDDDSVIKIFFKGNEDEI